MDELPRPRPLDFPTGSDPVSVRRRIEAMEQLLERSFAIPGINRPVGLDAIAGLSPVVGDLVAAALGAYIIWEANNLGLPKWKLWRMAGNVAFDTALGAIPIARDLLDLMLRFDSRHLRIVRHHREHQTPA